MSYTEVTRNWYWSRLWNSLKWVLFWVLLIIWSIILLWWNEWRTVDVASWLSSAEKITINGSIDEINTDLEWKLVYNKGFVDTKNWVLDNIFLIEWKFLKLDRVVEMYQWNQEVKEKREDNLWWSETVIKTYSYNQKWDTKRLDSINYKELWHTNPTYWLYKNKNTVSSDIKIWEFSLNQSYISKLDNYTNYNISNDDFIKYKMSNNYNSVHDWNYIYIWTWSNNFPVVWDIRVSFKIANPWDLSIIWVQKWNTFVPYVAANDTTVALLEYWNISMEQMYINAQSANSLLAWILRWLWLFLMFVWFKLFFDIFVIIAKVIPFLSSVIEFWTITISFILTITIWWLTIAIAWFASRPIISLIIIWIIWSITYFVLTKKSKNKKTP